MIQMISLMMRMMMITYDEDEWEDEECDEDDTRTYVATDCETTVVERRTREHETVKVPAPPYLA